MKEQDTVRLGLIGAAGRMGREIVRCAATDPRIEVAAAVDAASHPDLGADAGVLAGLAPIGVAVGDDLGALTVCGVVADFSHHSAVRHNAAFAAENGLALIVGTTGLGAAEQESLRAAASTVAVLSAPNMSVGITILCDVVRRVAAALGDGYDAEIVEMHHRHKKDAPSGTALRLAEELARGRGVHLPDVACFGRHGNAASRNDEEIGIHSVRGGDIVGDHRVIFAGDGESMTLEHRATSRATLARGVLRAAAWLSGRAPGLYGMHDVLGLPQS